MKSSFGRFVEAGVGIAILVAVARLIFGPNFVTPQRVPSVVILAAVVGALAGIVLWIPYALVKGHRKSNPVNRGTQSTRFNMVAARLKVVAVVLTLIGIFYEAYLFRSVPQTSTAASRQTSAASTPEARIPAIAKAQTEQL